MSRAPKPKRIRSVAPKPAKALVVPLTKLKGGVGASTLTRELALAAMIEDNFSVALVDLDQQGATTHWWNRRKERGDVQSPEFFQATDGIKGLLGSLDMLREECNLVLVDCPPTVHPLMRELVSRSTLSIVPTRPNMSDLDAIGPVLDMLGPNAPRAFVITQITSTRSLEAREAATMLSEFAPVLGHTTNRVGYSRPPATGLTGYERDINVRLEVRKLWNAIRGQSF